MEMPWYQIAFLGAIGGIIPDVLRIVGARHDGNAPGYLLTWFFWVSLLLLGAIGAGAAYAAVTYAPPAQNWAITALGIGYSAPSIISKLLGSVSLSPEGAAPAPTRGRRDGAEKANETVRSSGGIRGWWAR